MTLNRFNWLIRIAISTMFLVTNGWQKWGLELFIHPDEEKCCNWRRQVVQCGVCLSTIIMVPCILNDNDVLKLGEHELKSFLCRDTHPAHMFHCESQHFLIGGMYFLESIGHRPSYGNHEQLLQNIRQRLYVLPGDTTVYRAMARKPP